MTQIYYYIDLDGGPLDTKGMTIGEDYIIEAGCIRFCLSGNHLTKPLKVYKSEKELYEALEEDLVMSYM